ncbi:hypothetical protein DY000_02020887 [Brassica cretica]|uniref:Zinc finger GRF-type domain-containing protein n=1 Tax=Brassica cretica TaxID=69181 RepID=A0ABQ7EGC2_BRACR|nr:hypothetical protein DY000_02020887 [Brassica cretica]
MTDPYYAYINQWKRDSDRRELVLYAHHCIPQICACGAPIRLSTDENGKSYFECKEFEDDGFHIRRGCFNAFGEELEELNEKVAEEAKGRTKMVDEMKKMREDIKLLKELCMEGDEHRCFDAVKERLQEVKEEVAEEARIRKKMEDELKKMLEDIKLLKELCGC